MDARQALTPRPPRLAEALLRRVVPPGASGLSIVGDLREEFAARALAGRHAARVWYWRQTIGVAWRSALFARDEGGQRHGAMALFADLRSSFRMAISAPGTSSLVVITLAAAIGAATVGFTFADLALLRGMPVDDPEVVVQVHGVDARASTGRASISPANYRDLRARMQTLTHMAAFRVRRSVLSADGVPTSLRVMTVTGEYFAALGHPAVLGRLLADGDDRPGALPVVVLSHRYWHAVFAGAPDVLGRTMTLDGRALTIVGVLTPEVEIGTISLIDAYVPLEVPADVSRRERSFTVLARLAYGQSLASANAELQSVSAALAAEFPDVNEGWQAAAIPILEAMAGRGFWLTVTLFLVAITLLVAIACANVANIMLARQMARRRELAVRAALGASRFRIVRLSVLEGAWLALGAALLAMPMAELGLRAIRSVDAEPVLQQMRLDWHEASFAIAVALAAPLLFALVPALGATRADLRSTLQAGGVRSGHAGRRVREALVVLQLTLAVALLIGAGVSVHTALNLSGVRPGLRTERMLTFGMELPPRDYATPDHVRAALERVRDAASQVPGAESAHLLESLPMLRDLPLVSVQIDRALVRALEEPWALAMRADAGALAALHVPLLAGRWLTDAEDAREAPVVLVGQETAVRYYGSADAAVGRRISLSREGVARDLAIVGVVGDVLSGDYERGPVPRVWLPLGTPRRVTVVVPTHVATADVAGPLRQALAAVAPLVPAEGLEGYDAALWRFRASNYVMIGVFTGFALLSLGLAAAGLYGVVSHSVGQRIPEFGTRFALGAQVRDVIGLVLRDASRALAAGLLLGTLGGFAFTMALRTTLYQVQPIDPVSLLAVGAVLVTVTVLASVIPALRAARVDLVAALRLE